MTDQPQQTVSVEFTIGVGDGQIVASANVPVGATNLTQILPVLQSMEDSMISGMGVQLAEAGHPISCRAGCGACCRQMVPLGLIDRMVNEDWLADTESARQLALDYLYQRVACPFLEDESCSIHPIRPLVCREYLVISPPAHCFDPAALQVIPAHPPLHLSRVLNRMGAELEGDARGWIPLLFLFAWMEAGASPGNGYAGTGPEVLHKFLEHIGEAQIPARTAARNAD